MATRVALMYPECGEQNEYRMHSACRSELSASHSGDVSGEGDAHQPALVKLLR